MKIALLGDIAFFGKFSLIGAGSIVTKNIPPYSMAAGSPAKVIAKRCKKC